MTGEKSVVTGFMSCPVLEQYMEKIGKEKLHGSGIGTDCSCHYHLGNMSLSASFVTNTSERCGVTEGYYEHHPLENISICSIILCTTNPEEHQELIKILEYSKKALTPANELRKYLEE